MNHLDRETLLRFLRDELDESENAEASEHIEECAECESLLESLSDAAAPPRISEAPAMLDAEFPGEAVYHTTHGGDEPMHKPAPIHDHSQRGFAWRAFLLGIVVILLPLLLIVPLVGGLVLFTARDAQRSEAMLRAEVRQAEAVRRTAELARASEAAVAEDTMSYYIEEESSVGSEPDYVEGTAIEGGDSSYDEGTSGQMGGGGLPRSGISAGSMGMSRMGNAPKPAAQTNYESRLISMLDELLVQQRKQSEILERQADQNEQVLRLLQENLSPRADSRSKPRQSKPGLGGSEFAPGTGSGLGGLGVGGGDDEGLVEGKSDAGFGLGAPGSEVGGAAETDFGPGEGKADEPAKRRGR